MDEILRKLVEEYSFLYKEYGLKIVDSLYTEVFGGDSYVILSNNELQIRFTRDRGQLFIQIKNINQIKWEPLHIIKNEFEGINHSTSFMNTENALFLKKYLENKFQ
jgi:hypothetical protein